MPQVGIRFGGKLLTWEEARVESHNPGFPFPPPLVEAMAKQREDNHPSASSIVGCLRRFELQRKLSWYGDATGQLPPLFGTAFHSLMDGYRSTLIKPGQLTETRLTALVDTGRGEIPFSGQFDFFSPGELISDWKTKAYIPQGFTPPEEHVRQVNIYNWLAEVNGLEPAPTWELAYVSQTWAARFQGATDDTASAAEFVTKRLRRWKRHADNGTLPPPVPQLFQPDARGRLPSPCGYCPVREQCLEALREYRESPF